LPTAAAAASAAAALLVNRYHSSASRHGTKRGEGSAEHMQGAVRFLVTNPTQIYEEIFHFENRLTFGSIVATSL